MRLKLHRSLKDAEGNEIAREPIGKIAAFANPDNPADATTEVAEIDAIEIVGIAFHRKEAFFHVSFQLGALNSNGIFVPAEQYKEALWSISRAQTPALWDKYLKGRKVFDLTKLEVWMHAEGVMKGAATSVWELKDIDSEVVGQSASPKVSKASKEKTK